MLFCYIPESTLCKTAAVRPLTSHLTNHPNKTRHERHCFEVRMNSIAKFSHGLLHMDILVLANQLTYISSVVTLDVVWRTNQQQWMIWTVGKRESQGNQCYQDILMKSKKWNLMKSQKKINALDMIIKFMCV